MDAISESNTFSCGLIAFSKSGTTIHSAAVEVNIGKDTRYDFLTFLGIAQSLNIDFLPITWQPELDAVGRGGTAEIRQICVKRQTNYTFKRLMPARQEKTKTFQVLIAEILVLGQPSIRGHPNIAELQGICWDVVSGTEEIWPVLVFGTARHGDLMAFMERGEGRKLSLEDRLKLCIDIATGVMDMHLNSVIHGDIKPKNVLIYENTSAGYTAKVADFGYSTMFADKDATINMPGSPHWVAPEWHHRNYTTDVIGAKKMDVYSFGMLCLWLLFYNTHEIASSKLYGDLRSEMSALALAHHHVTGTVDLNGQNRKILYQLFKRTLEEDPANRTSDFTELFSLLAPQRAKDHQSPQRMGLDIHLPSGCFKIGQSMAQLYLADYRVRTFIAESLKESASEASSLLQSQKFALELAFCYKVGFGVAKDESASHSLVQQNRPQCEELEHRVCGIKEGNGVIQFRNSVYARLVDQGYDVRIDLVECYRADQQLDVATSQYRREIADLKSVLGPDHLIVQILVTQLCHILREVGHRQEAWELRAEITETMIRVLGEGHPDTLMSMGNLAAIYIDQGKWKEAENIQARVLKAQISLLGHKHSDTLESMGVLSTIYRLQGRLKEAEELQLQAVETRVTGLGMEHPDTLRSISDLAATYLEQRKLGEAERLLLRVLKIRKAVLGEKHMDTIRSMGNLATTYYKQKRINEAEELGSRVADIEMEALGQGHPDTLTSLSNLASMRKDLGRLEEAEILEEQLIETKSRVLGPDHPSTLTSLGNLALTHGLRKQWEKAEKLGNRVVDMKTRILGRDHPSTLASMANLADAYEGLGLLQEAEELLVRVMKIMAVVLGMDHPSTTAVMSQLASIYRNQGRWKEADEPEEQPSGAGKLAGR